VIGQSGKPLGVIFPPTIMGNVSDSRQRILLNTLDDEISQYFDVSPPTNVSSGDLPVVNDVFQLQIVEEDGDTQLSLRWTSGNERKVETILCGGCKTIELNGKLEGLVGKLFGGNKIEPVVMVGKRGKGVLYFVNRNGKNGWYKDSYYYNDWKYVGEIKNGEPNGQGTLTWTDGTKYVGMFKDGKRNGQGIWTWSKVGQKNEGEWKDGKQHGQGITTYPNGDKYVGEYKDGKIWNGTRYYKDGKIKYKIVYGEWYHLSIYGEWIK